MFLYSQNAKDSYVSLYNQCQVNIDKKPDATDIIQKILANKSRYDSVANVLLIPWYVIAVIHNMECDLDFTCHLYNGDPLSARTVDEPSGRPLIGNPPFTWEYSAVDALKFDGFDHWGDWSISGTCYELEKYNGFGYRAFNINSPYLWSGSNLYTAGKFTSDGIFSPTAVSDQIGAMTILKMMALNSTIQFPSN